MAKEEGTIRPARLFKELSNSRTRCHSCERKCLISQGKRGFCGTFENRKGRLHTLTYGDISAAESRPMEIKPFFHFHPGQRAVTISSWGCNLTCPWCQNHHISRGEPRLEKADHVPPGRIVQYALREGDKGTCVSFGEPTILMDYCLDLFPLARHEGLFNTIVTNGYQSKRSLKALRDSGLDAMSIDLKGDGDVYKKYCGGAKVDAVLRNIETAKKMGIHVEVVNLLITGVNDDEASVGFIIENVLERAGPDTPLHFTRYFPAYEFERPPTEVEVLERAIELARKEGVKFPYIGNVMGNDLESTFCPRCGKKVIGRMGGRMVSFALDNAGKCLGCGTNIPLIGWAVPDWD